MNEYCSIMPVVYIITHFTTFVAGFVLAMWAITRKPDFDPGGTGPH